MARKLDPAKLKQPAAAPATQADTGLEDLAVMHPDVTLELAGRKVVVREYRFWDGQEARAIGQPLTQTIAELLQHGATRDLTIEDYEDLLARHRDIVCLLMARSIEGADEAWIKSLSPADGDALLLTWWGVSGRFFVRLALRRAIARSVHDTTAALAGRTSSTPSPDATAPRTNSATATPSVS